MALLVGPHCSVDSPQWAAHCSSRLVLGTQTIYQYRNIFMYKYNEGNCKLGSELCAVRLPRQEHDLSCMHARLGGRPPTLAHHKPTGFTKEASDNSVLRAQISEVRHHPNAASKPVGHSPRKEID